MHRSRASAASADLRCPRPGWGAGWRRALVVGCLAAGPLIVAPASPVGAPVAQAQDGPRLVVGLPENPLREGPTVRVLGVLDDRRVLDHLHAGFPTRLLFRTELWSTGGLVNDIEGTAEWEVLVRYDRLDRSYVIARGTPDARPQLLGRYATLQDLSAAIERPYQPVIDIRRRGRRYYYNVVVGVQTMSANDLDEVERWLRGELRPAVRGERNPGTAVTRGLRTLTARLIGGPQRTLRQRTGTFFVS